MLHNLIIMGPGLLAQRPNDPAGAGAAILVGMLCPLVLWGGTAILIIAGLWKVFEKAGEPGWAAIIPIYNGVVLLRISGKPEWWILLYFIPIVGLIVSIIATIELCNRFRVGGGFAVGLILLPMIFYPILGFGSAQYEGRGSRLRGRKRRRPIEDDYEDEDDDRPAPRRRPAKRVRVEEDYEDEEEPVDEEPQPAPRPAPRQQTATATPVSCPGCGVSLKLPATLPSGKKVRCPKCSTTFEVP